MYSLRQLASPTIKCVRLLFISLPGQKRQPNELGPVLGPLDAPRFNCLGCCSSKRITEKEKAEGERKQESQSCQAIERQRLAHLLTIKGSFRPWRIRPEVELVRAPGLLVIFPGPVVVLSRNTSLLYRQNLGIGLFSLCPNRIVRRQEVIRNGRIQHKLLYSQVEMDPGFCKSHMSPRQFFPLFYPE